MGKVEEISDRLPSPNRFKHPARMSPQAKASRNYVKVLFLNPVASSRGRKISASQRLKATTLREKLKRSNSQKV